MRQSRQLIILSTFLIFTFFGCRKSNDFTVPAPPASPIVPGVPSVVGDNDHMLMGNPNGAAFTTDSINNYLMRKSYYALSYNSTKGTPNWVSWHLFPLDLGGTPRQDDFREDNTLPAAWYHVQSFSFSGSGFDRGHNCPSGDRTNNIEGNSATFLMTNMIPQAPGNNQLTWNNMEMYIRSQMGNTKEAYIIMGSYGIGGTGNTGYATTISGGNITVPSFIWKVVVLIDNSNSDLSRVNTTTRVIAVITPNTNAINSNWKTYRTTVDNIEAATGYNLLSELPVSVQNVLEATVDTL